MTSSRVVIVVSKNKTLQFTRLEQTWDLQAENALKYPLCHDNNLVAELKSLDLIQTRIIKLVKSWKFSKDFPRYLRLNRSPAGLDFTEAFIPRFPGLYLTLIQLGSIYVFHKSLDFSWVWDQCCLKSCKYQNSSWLPNQFWGARQRNGIIVFTKCSSVAVFLLFSCNKLSARYVNWRRQ